MTSLLSAKVYFLAFIFIITLSQNNQTVISVSSARRTQLSAAPFLNFSQHLAQIIASTFRNQISVTILWL